jgi:prepilin-type processing-associated H-X9-DG protein
LNLPGFKSLHPGGANFLLGDGAVLFLTQNIDHNNYQALGGKSDGKAAILP